MSKKFKLLVSALMICGSLVSVVPANAATKDNSAKATKATEEVEKPNADIEAKSGEITTVNTEDVCLRAKPGIGSTVYRMLQPGDKISYIQYNAGYANGCQWSKVRYLGKDSHIDGYVATKYIQ